jgi:hypothetical protein
MNTKVLSCFERLCLQLNALCSSTSSNCSARDRLILCQCVTRASKIICSVGYGCVASHVIEMPSDGQLMSLASALNTLSISVVTVKTICGEESYAVNMLFWSACDALSCIVDMMVRKKNEQGREFPQKQATIALIFGALTLTTPSPQDLCAEIYRLQHVQSDSMIEKQGSEKALGSGLVSGSRLGSTSGMYETYRSSDQSEDPNPNPNPNIKEKGCTFESFRLQFLLDGLQRVLKSGILENKEERNDITKVCREDWMASIAEALLCVLEHGSEKGSKKGFQKWHHKESEKRSGRGSEIGSEKGSQFSVSIISLAPLLAKMLLEVSHSFNSSISNTTDWIFWELAEVNRSRVRVRG